MHDINAFSCQCDTCADPDNFLSGGVGGGVHIPRRGRTENFNMAKINNLAIPGGGGGVRTPCAPLWIRPCDIHIRIQAIRVCVHEPVNAAVCHFTSKTFSRTIARNKVRKKDNVKTQKKSQRNGQFKAIRPDKLLQYLYLSETTFLHFNNSDAPPEISATLIHLHSESSKQCHKQFENRLTLTKKKKKKKKKKT